TVCQEGLVHADPGSPTSPTTTATASAPTQHSEHAIYVELLGKGGLYGVGYDYQFHPRLAVGATGSYYVLDGQEVLDFSPYLVAYLVGTGRHRWFVQGGPEL